MSEVSQPNEHLIETIEKALEEATPGPWQYHGDAVSHGGYGKWICQMYEGVGPFHNDEANAHLIANAPEWLRALLEEVKGLEQSVDVWETEAWRAIGELKKTKEALNKCLIGGNSLASVVIGWSLPGGYEEWAYEQASNYFYGKYDNETAYEYYETWLCWKAIREAGEGESHE